MFSSADDAKDAPKNIRAIIARMLILVNLLFMATLPLRFVGPEKCF